MSGGESMSVRSDQATQTGAEPRITHRPRIRVVAELEVSGNEWVSPDLVAYAARQFAATFAAKIRDAADDLQAKAEAEPWTPPDGTSPDGAVSHD